MNTLKIYRRSDEALLPQFATEGSAGFDLSACLELGDRIKTFNPWNKDVDVPVKMASGKPSIQIHPGYRIMIPTGLIFDIEPGYVLKVFSRSGIALKKGVVVPNGVGIIDSDYINETFVLLYNTSDGPISISHGDRIAQAILEKTEQYTIEEISEQPTQKTEREGGFGSTGE